jgi:hypothetical protein
MFKKSIHIIFILLWTITTTGFTISRHYCGDRLISVSIDDSAESCCGPESGCCHNENEHIQVKDDFIAAQELENPPLPEYDNLFPVVYSYLSNIPVQITDQKDNYLNSHPPPKLSVILSELQSFLC